MSEEGSGKGLIVVLGLLLLFIALIAFCMSWEQVPAGAVGVKDKFGEIFNDEYQPGLYFTGPFVHLREMNTRVQGLTLTEVGISRDSQEITTETVINYRLKSEDANVVYKGFATDVQAYAELIMRPIVVSIIKTETAKYSADKFSENWDTIRDSITEQVQAKLKDTSFIVTEVSLTDFDFKPEYQASIERKQIAVQDSFRAVSEKQTAITQSEARQQDARNTADGYAYGVKAKADADAYALRVVREELEKSTNLIEYKTIEKWNGALPSVQTSGQSDLLISLPVK